MILWLELIFGTLFQTEKISLYFLRKKKSSSLLQNFDIVATIDGSIGWEAIKNLKPVICFGKPWYLLMPGVFQANKVSNLENVLQKKMVAR